MTKDSFRTIANQCEGQFKIKGSKFIAFGYPVNSEEEIENKLKNLKKKFHNARHHCYAYRLGNEGKMYRYNDDGEPSGTAGKPIYGRLLSHELSNILMVVVRYFGGTLLGTSGLINAYRSATEDCIRNAKIIEQTIDIDVKISFGYEQINKVMRIIKDGAITIKNQNFENVCTMQLSIRKKNYDISLEQLMKVRDLELILP